MELLLPSPSFSSQASGLLAPNPSSAYRRYWKTGGYLQKQFVLACVVAVFLSLPSYGSAAATDSTGRLGYKTVKYWQSLQSTVQLYYLLGSLDASIVSCSTDLATVGAMEIVLRNRISDGTVRLSDTLFSSINKIAIDFGCSTILPMPDVTAVSR